MSDHATDTHPPATDGHAGADALGQLDPLAWGSGALGILLGLAVVVALLAAVG
jgi:hypothetical protein